ncbi:MAG TPA: EamA family transporter [Candidatus Nanoarchaeia archaeon]|nr:EamA family transporter [Candidatus Nanoarchaeia archaeon]
MTTKPWAILLILLTTFLTSSAQILYKLSIPSLTFSIRGILTNYYLIGGLALYGIGAILMIISFRGGEVSVLYPIIATSYVWVSILSIYFLKEQMNIFRWIGVFVIIAGIILIGYGSKEEVPIVGV